MESTKDAKLGLRSTFFSRRELLKGAAALTAAASVPQAFGQQPTGAPRGTVWLYIGTYTGAPGSGGNGQGIYLCQLNLSTGELTVLKLVSASPPMGTAPRSPSTIALDPTRTHLYAGNEFGPPGAVSAYSINRLTGDLTLLNVQPAAGAPAHVCQEATKFPFRFSRSNRRNFSAPMSLTAAAAAPIHISSLISVS